MLIMMPSAKTAKNGSAPPNKRAVRALEKKYHETTYPEPLVQIQNNLTEKFLMIPFTKIEQTVPLGWTKGHQSPRKEISLNNICPWTAGLNLEYFHRNVPHYTLDQNCTNVSFRLTKGPPEL